MAILDYIRQGVKLSSTWNAKLSFPTQGWSHASFLEVHPSLASQNTTLPFLTNPLPPIGKDSSPFKMQNPYKSFHTIFFISWLFTLFLFYLYFIFSFLLFPSNFLFPFFFFFSPKSWNSSPKWKNYSPAFGMNNRRIDAPDPVWVTWKPYTELFPWTSQTVFTIFCFQKMFEITKLVHSLVSNNCPFTE